MISNADIGKNVNQSVFLFQWMVHGYIAILFWTQDYTSWLPSPPPPPPLSIETMFFPLPLEMQLILI